MSLAAPKLNQRKFFAARSWIELVLVTLGFFLLVVAIQSALRSYSAEFLSDDASHYVSGLLVHDYLRAGLSNPLTYLKTFHSHYPEVGIGHWGPMFYAAEGVWMLFFGVGRNSVMVFSAVLAAATAIGLYAFCRSVTNRAFALFAGVAFLASPMIQESASALMLDIPVALLCFCAMWSYVRYLDTGRIRFSVAFALIASAAMLTKGNAGCLAFLPPLAVVIGRRFDLLGKLSFWTPVPVVAILAGPWYALTYGQVAVGFRYQWGLAYAAQAIEVNLRILWANAGPLILFFALFGLVETVRRGRVAPSALIGASALVGAVFIFQSVVPAALEGRYLAPLMPPLLVLAVYGAQESLAWIAARMNERGVRVPEASVLSVAAILVLGLSILPLALNASMQQHEGFRDAARQVWEHRIAGNSSVLIAADGSGEGAEIAELAMLDPERPSLFAIRGSRLLGGGGYNNQDYEPLFKTAEEAMAELDKYNVPLVLLRADTSAKPWAHIGQLEEAARLYPDRWELIYQDRSVSPVILFYRIRGNTEKTGDHDRLLALSAPKALGQ